MTRFIELVSNTKIHHREISVPVNMTQIQSEALMSCDVIIDEIVRISGAEKFSAKSIADAMTSNNVAKDLQILCQEFSQVLASNQLQAKVWLFKVPSPQNEYGSDVYWMPETGLNIEITQAEVLDKVA